MLAYSVYQLNGEATNQKVMSHLDFKLEIAEIFLQRRTTRDVMVGPTSEVNEELFSESLPVFIPHARVKLKEKSKSTSKCQYKWVNTKREK